MKINTGFRFINDSSIYIIASIFTTIINLGTLPIFTKFLSPSDFGVVALFILFGSVVVGVFTLDVHQASYRFYFDYKDERSHFKKVNSTNMIFMLILYIILYFIISNFSNWISAVLFKSKLDAYLIKLSFISGALGQIYLSNMLLITAKEEKNVYAIMTILFTLFSVAFSFYFIFFQSLTYLSKVYGIIISQIILVILSLYYNRRLYSFYFSFNLLKNAILYTYPRIPRQIISTAGDSIDKLLLNQFAGLQPLGNYTFGVKFASLIQLVVSGIDKVFTPFFMGKANDTSESAKLQIVEKYYGIISFILVVGLSIIYFSEEMIKLLTSKEFYPAMYVTPIYTFYRLFGLIGTAAANQLMFAKELIHFLPATIINVVITLSLNLVLIPKFGGIGAAITATIGALFSNMYLFHSAQKVYPLPFEIKKIILAFLLIIVFVLPIYPLMFYNVNFFLKIVIKLVLLLLFCVSIFWIKIVDMGVFINIISSFSPLNKLIKNEKY